jgi:methyl-accepting chemotaxis protein
MTQGVQDLIKAIDSGDSQVIDAAFQAEMANRISTRLEDLRVSVAQNMFATEQAAEETAEEVSEEAEEIEEDVEQIDELSKKTMGSYTKKAANDMADKAHELGQNGEEPDYDDYDDSETETGALRRGVDNRQKGIATAVKKLSK